MHTWHSFDNNCYWSPSDYTQSVRGWRDGSKARSRKLVKQIVWSNHASLHLFTSCQSLIPGHPSLNYHCSLTHKGSIESLHSIVFHHMPKAKPFILLPSLSYHIFCFFLPLTPPHCLTLSPSRVSYHACEKRQYSCSVCMRVWRQTVREGQCGACRETLERGKWQGSNTNQYLTHTPSLGPYT